MKSDFCEDSPVMKLAFPCTVVRHWIDLKVVGLSPVGECFSFSPLILISVCFAQASSTSTYVCNNIVRVAVGLYC